MLYFGFIYLLILVLCEEKRKKGMRFLLALIPFLLIIFLRFGIGADYFSYENIYNLINPNNLWQSIGQLPKIELLYIVINYIAVKIGVNYHIFVGILASFMIIMTLKWLYDNSPNFELSALLHISMLFIYWNISALRQGIVLTVLTFIYFNPKLKLSKRDKYTLTAILFFMHPTALIVPVFYFISKYDWDRKKIFILIFPIPFVRLLFHPKVLYIFYRIPYMSKILKYSDYNSIRLLSTPSLMRFSFFIFIWYHYDKLIEKYPDYKRAFIFSLLSLIFYFYLPTAMVIGTRTTIYGFFLIILIFPMILELYKGKKLYVWVLTGLLIIAGLSYYNELNKLKARTGYEYSINKLNFETVFQKNRINFNNMYAFKYMVDKENENFVRDSHLLWKSNSDVLWVETRDKKNHINIPVWFEGYKGYGYINEKGQVLQLPTSQYNKPNSWWREQIRVENNLSEFIVKEHEPEWLEQFETLKRFNTNTIVNIFEYKKGYFDRDRYIRLATEYESYFIFMRDGEILIDRLYNRIIPFSDAGFAIGYTNSYIEIINLGGEIIWVEPR